MNPIEQKHLSDLAIKCYQDAEQERSINHPASGALYQSLIQQGNRYESAAGIHLTPYTHASVLIEKPGIFSSWQELWTTWGKPLLFIILLCGLAFTAIYEVIAW